MKSKRESFESVIKQLDAGVTMLQETKLYRKGTMKFKNMCVFEKIRNQNEGGGLMTLIHENFKPVLIPMENCSQTSQNVLVVECTIGQKRMRFINAYGVQETASVEVRSEFFSLLDQEVQFCLNQGIYLCMELDANAKVGEVIQNNPQETISPNGILLLDIIERNNLILVNGTDICEGKITRQKMKNGKLEKSVLDYFLVCQDFFLLVQKM